MDLIADTSFLIGLWRRQSWAVTYATANARKPLVTRNIRHFGAIPELRVEALT